MTEELRALIERLCRQPEDVQRHMAEIIQEELDEEEGLLEYSPEFLRDLEESRQQIANGDYVDYETLAKELREREQQ